VAGVAGDPVTDDPRLPPDPRRTGPGTWALILFVAVCIGFGVIAAEVVIQRSLMP
jgi:hypothetical protein